MNETEASNGAAPTDRRPGLTACSLCAGETLGEADGCEGGQLARLRALESRGLARLTTVECLDECERGDVLVVRPAPGGRCRGAAPVWFEQLAGDGPTDHLAEWLAHGGPGSADVPSSLAPFVIDRAAAAGADPSGG